MPEDSDHSGRGGRRKVHASEVFDDDYNERRRRNNEAVRKSRDKSKKKAEDTLMRVDELKVENAKLETQIQIYKKQLAGLKEVLLNHAASGNVPMDINFEELLRDSDGESGGQ